MNYLGSIYWNYKELKLCARVEKQLNVIVRNIAVFTFNILIDRMLIKQLFVKIKYIKQCQVFNTIY